MGRSGTNKMNTSISMGMMKSEMEDRKFNKNLFLKKINKSLKKVIVYPLNLKHFIASMVCLN